MKETMVENTSYFERMKLPKYIYDRYKQEGKL